MQSFNPYTQKIIQDYSEFSIIELQEKIEATQNAFKIWKETSFEKRASLMLNLASLLKKNKKSLGELMTNEMGKPIKQSIAEVEKCAWLCEYYAEIAEKTLQNKIIETDASKSYVRYEPLGIVLAVMPWNYPFWQYFRFIVPNLMAGNVGLLKHASNVSGCALAIENLFYEAGFPENVSTTLLVSSKNTAQIIEHNLVKAVTLTGSFAAGSAVAALSGKHIKKTVLELGGNNALIVFDDADLESTLNTVVNARYQNAGQSCIAGKRLLIQKSIADIFTSKLKEKVSTLKFGNPLDSETEIGVLAQEKFALDLEKQMNESIKMGAKLMLGGKRENAFFEPTILINVSEEMPVFKEETFGPLLGITIFQTEDEAIALSNNSEFGLGVSIFTENETRIQKMISSLDEGAVFINELVKSDPRLPFGGIKNSGYGRELSTDALFEFMNIKTVFIK